MREGRNMREQARRSRDQELGIVPSVLFGGDRGGKLRTGSGGRWRAG